MTIQEQLRYLKKLGHNTYIKNGNLYYRDNKPVAIWTDSNTGGVRFSILDNNGNLVFFTNDGKFNKTGVHTVPDTRTALEKWSDNVGSPIFDAISEYREKLFDNRSTLERAEDAIIAFAKPFGNAAGQITKQIAKAATTAALNDGEAYRIQSMAGVTPVQESLSPEEKQYITNTIGEKAGEFIADVTPYMIPYVNDAYMVSQGDKARRRGDYTEMALEWAFPGASALKTAGKAALSTNAGRNAITSAMLNFNVAKGDLPKVFFSEPVEVSAPAKAARKRLLKNGAEDYPLYSGPLHSISEIVNIDGTVNPYKLKQIQREISEYFGVPEIQYRAENPVWHKTDPNTWIHTKQVAQNAYKFPVPEGFTKQDQMFTALGHDVGKMLAGDGHEFTSAELVRQIFPDATEAHIEAIAKHMGDYSNSTSTLARSVKNADRGEILRKGGRLIKKGLHGLEVPEEGIAKNNSEENNFGIDVKKLIKKKKKYYIDEMVSEGLDKLEKTGTAGKIAKNVIELVDPTGITGWRYIKEDALDFKDSPSLIKAGLLFLAIPGGVPVLGKAAKTIRAKNAAKHYNGTMKELGKIINRVSPDDIPKDPTKTLTAKFNDEFKKASENKIVELLQNESENKVGKIYEALEQKKLSPLEILASDSAMEILTGKAESDLNNLSALRLDLSGKESKIPIELKSKVNAIIKKLEENNPNPNAEIKAKIDKLETLKDAIKDGKPLPVELGASMEAMLSRFSLNTEPTVLRSLSDVKKELGKRLVEDYDELMNLIYNDDLKSLVQKFLSLDDFKNSNFKALEDIVSDLNFIKKRIKEKNGVFPDLEDIPKEKLKRLQTLCKDGEKFSKDVYERVMNMSKSENIDRTIQNLIYLVRLRNNPATKSIPIGELDSEEFSKITDYLVKLSDSLESKNPGEMFDINLWLELAGKSKANFLQFPFLKEVDQLMRTNFNDFEYIDALNNMTRMGYFPKKITESVDLGLFAKRVSENPQESIESLTKDYEVLGNFNFYDLDNVPEAFKEYYLHSNKQLARMALLREYAKRSLRHLNLLEKHDAIIYRPKKVKAKNGEWRLSHYSLGVYNSESGKFTFMDKFVNQAINLEGIAEETKDFLRKILKTSTIDKSILLHHLNPLAKQIGDVVMSPDHSEIRRELFSNPRKAAKDIRNAHIKSHPTKLEGKTKDKAKLYLQSFLFLDQPMHTGAMNGIHNLMGSLSTTDLKRFKSVMMQNIYNGATASNELGSDVVLSSAALLIEALAYDLPYYRAKLKEALEKIQEIKRRPLVFPEGFDKDYKTILQSIYRSKQKDLLTALKQFPEIPDERIKNMFRTVHKGNFESYAKIKEFIDAVSDYNLYNNRLILTNKLANELHITFE